MAINIQILFLNTFLDNLTVFKSAKIWKYINVLCINTLFFLFLGNFWPFVKTLEEASQFIARVSTRY